jgi:hypothetical protein
MNGKSPLDRLRANGYDFSFWKRVFMKAIVKKNALAIKKGC